MAFLPQEFIANWFCSAIKFWMAKVGFYAALNIISVYLYNNISVYQCIVYELNASLTKVSEAMLIEYLKPRNLLQRQSKVEYKLM